MTAYGRAEYQHEDMLFVAEVRSLNHRYRDIILRIPKPYQLLDEDLRGIIAERVRRGRIEVAIQMERTGEESPYDLELNAPLVASYLGIFKRLSEEFGLERDVSADRLCQMKDVILLSPRPVDLERVRPGFSEALRRAMDSLDEMREREGRAIEADFQKRLARLEGDAEEIHERAPLLIDAYRERLRGNMERMLQEVSVDEARLAQEVAFFAERSNITEELVRLRSHLDQFRAYLNGEGALGRRLDFLIQEMHREVNTLSSKASDSQVSARVVEMKAELEKLREQVQNVE
jgi:uncharacterized protein (TIGR00255 family)